MYRADYCLKHFRAQSHKIAAVYDLLKNMFYLLIEKLLHESLRPEII